MYCKGTSKLALAIVLPQMKTNTLFFWFFVIGGFVTAAVGVSYFASGESMNGSQGQNYAALMQIPLGVAVTLYGINYVGDKKRRG